MALAALLLAMSGCAGAADQTPAPQPQAQQEASPTEEKANDVVANEEETNTMKTESFASSLTFSEVKGSGTCWDQSNLK